MICNDICLLLLPDPDDAYAPRPVKPERLPTTVAVYNDI